MSSEEARKRPQYALGGIPPTRWMSAGRAIMAGLLFVGALILIVALSQSRIWWLMPLALLMGALSWFIYTRKSYDGRPWLTNVVSSRARRVAARLGRWDEYDPDFDDRPWLVDDYSVLSVSAVEDDEGLCLLDTGRTNAYVAVIEVDGDGHGVRSSQEHTFLERNFHQFIDKLCSPNELVSQIDLITKVSPESGAPFVEWTEQRLRADATDDARASAMELAHGGDLMSSQIRSWAVLVMPIDGLVRHLEELSLSISPELLAEAAAETVTTVTRSMVANGIRIHQGLSPSQAAAVIRGIMLPDYSVDDTSDIEEFWDAWPGFQPSSRGNSLVTYGADRGTAWFHRSAVIPRDGFPTEVLVNGRWLEGPVLESVVPYRVVSTKFLLIPHHEARGIAKDRLTTAQGKVIRQNRSGAISDGEMEDNMTLAQRVAVNIRRQGKGGVIPVVRVLVSATSERMVTRMSETLESELQQNLGVVDVSWDVPALGMIATLPLGTEVRRK